MADNTPLPLATGSTRAAASDQVTHSGDTADVQLVRIVEVTGAEGSKVPVSPYALVSTGNSSTAVLAASAVFTGAWEDVSDYSHIAVNVFVSHVSATDGLQLQQSSNGTDADLGDVYTIPATTGKSFSAPVQAKFCRVVYTNSGTLQTVMRLQTIYSKQAKKGSSVRPQDSRSNDNDFEEALAYGMGYNGSTWDRLLATLGKLNVIQPDITASGSLTAAAQTVSLALSGQSGAVVQISGTWVGTITFEGTVNGTNFDPINGVFSASSTPKTTATVNGLYRITPAGLASMRVNMTAFTSGTAVISIRASAGVGGTFANQVLPVEIDPRRLISFRGRASTFRIPGRAGTTGQKLFSIHNATGSTILVDVDKFKIDKVETVVKAVTVLPPLVRLYKVTVLPTNGTAVTKVARDSAQSSSASLTILQDASADGTSSATALTATLPAGTVIEGEFAPRLITAAGYEMSDRVEFLKETDELITLRPLEGLVVMLDYVLATQNPITDMWVVTAKWLEYTAV